MKKSCYRFVIKFLNRLVHARSQVAIVTYIKLSLTPCLYGAGLLCEINFARHLEGSIFVRKAIEITIEKQFSRSFIVGGSPAPSLVLMFGGEIHF